MTASVDVVGHPVDGAQMYINFDPSIVQVVDAAGNPTTTIRAGLTFPDVLLNVANNLSGTIGFAAGVDAATSPTNTFELGHFWFKALAPGFTGVSFNLSAPRQSKVTFGGNDILGSVTGSQIFVGAPTATATSTATPTATRTATNTPTLTSTPTATHTATPTGTATPLTVLVGSVTLQGRPTPPALSWIVPLTVTLDNGTVTTYTVTTDQNGIFAISGIQPGLYTVTVKNRHTLRNQKASVLLSTGSNSVGLGTLLEGDANDDNVVDITDYSIYLASAGKSTGDPGFDSRADFNEDGTVDSLDFSLLYSNYGQSGDLLLSMPWLTAGQATIAIAPDLITVAPGDIFTVDIVVDANLSAVDAAEAHLDFDPAFLEVVDESGVSATQIISGEALFAQVNSANNVKGTIDYLAGAGLPPAPPASGRFVLATVRFKALAMTLRTGITFSTVPPRRTNVVWGGTSILSGYSNGRVRILTMQNFLPLILE